MLNPVPPSDGSDLSCWLEFIAQAHPENIEMGLDRVRSVWQEMCARSNLDRIAPFVVLVSGTNGKGSTVSMLESVGTQLGLRVGTYSSPHIKHYNERIRVSGEAISDEAIVSGFEFVETAREGVPLTYFEYGTLGALYNLSQCDCDLVVLEIGLGGRLDAVNIVDADLAIVTSIGLDHQDWLGSDLEQIGREKAGIFRPGIPVLLGENMPGSVLESAQALDCVVYQAGKDFRFDGIKFSFRASTGAKYHEVLLQEETFLPANNIMLAVHASSQIPALIDRLDYSDPASWSYCLNLAATTRIEGRFEQLDNKSVTKALPERAQIYLDVGHNPHAAAHVKKMMERWRSQGYFIDAVFSSLEDKDAKGIVNVLENCVDRWFVGPLAVDRAMNFDSLESAVGSVVGKIQLHESFESALSQCIKSVSFTGESNRVRVIFIFGSFYAVEAAKAWFDNE